MLSVSLDYPLFLIAPSPRCSLTFIYKLDLIFSVASNKLKEEIKF